MACTGFAFFFLPLVVVSARPASLLQHATHSGANAVRGSSAGIFVWVGKIVDGDILILDHQKVVSIYVGLLIICGFALLLTSFPSLTIAEHA